MSVPRKRVNTCLELWWRRRESKPGKGCFCNPLTSYEIRPKPLFRKNLKLSQVLSRLITFAYVFVSKCSRFAPARMQHSAASTCFKSAAIDPQAWRSTCLAKPMPRARKALHNSSPKKTLNIAVNRSIGIQHLVRNQSAQFLLDVFVGERQTPHKSLR